ncbi:hypothetical protein PUN28_003457 [Cardiocondyla obscurior]|uniref:Uncharacterized protein n=1 Tax=Cardiocondyla obscurior TaxID=286306 RepID=A0AAW2GNN8_9HYME
MHLVQQKKNSSKRRNVERNILIYRSVSFSATSLHRSFFTAQLYDKFSRDKKKKRKKKRKTPDNHYVNYYIASRAISL